MLFSSLKVSMNVDPEDADDFVKKCLREDIERIENPDNVRPYDDPQEDKKLLKALKRAHNYYAPPSEHL